MHRLRGTLGLLMGASPTGAGRLFGPGEVRLALLSLLSDAPAHGYVLMKALEARCGGAYRASAGTIYPTLQRLQDDGLMRATASEAKSTYALTPQGRREVKRHARDIAQVWRRAEMRSEWAVLYDPDAAEILGPAMRLAKVALKAVAKSRGDPDVVDAIREVLDDARHGIERIKRRSKS